eukprot:gene9649-biopygen6212
MGNWYTVGAAQVSAVAHRCCSSFPPFLTFAIHFALRLQRDQKAALRWRAIQKTAPKTLEEMGTTTYHPGFRAVLFLLFLRLMECGVLRAGCGDGRAPGAARDVVQPCAVRARTSNLLAQILARPRHSLYCDSPCLNSCPGEGGGGRILHGRSPRIPPWGRTRTRGRTHMPRTRDTRAKLDPMYLLPVPVRITCAAGDCVHSRNEVTHRQETERDT